MLSIVDLIEADTFSMDLAAYALAAIGGGASFMIGALPQAAGKTTLMTALLNFVPADVELITADDAAVRDRPAPAYGGRGCYVCHEIGHASLYAYLWGESLRAYFALAAAGHMLATNLHADTYAQARAQICDDNPVPDEALWRMNLMFFLSVDGTGADTRRRIVAVWESDGRQPHRRIFGAEPAAPLAECSTLVSAPDLANARQRLEQLADRGARSLAEVRAGIVATAP